MKYPVRSYHIVQDHVGYLHHEPRHDYVANGYTDDISTPEFLEKLQRLASAWPLMLLRVVACQVNANKFAIQVDI